MLRNYTLQNNSHKAEIFNPVFPGHYLYFDKYFQKLSENKKHLSITISLFDGRVSVSVLTNEKMISIRGDKLLSYEVERHLMQLPAARTYSIEVN